MAVNFFCFSLSTSFWSLSELYVSKVSLN